MSEMHDLFLMAINFCIRRINQQEERFFREIFELYQAGLEHGAFYYYELGALREAMQHLLHIEYDDVLHNLVAKTMLSKIYYALEEFDALENHLDSIQIYIRRKKVLGYHRDNYLAFVRFVRKLLTVKMNSAFEKEKFRQEILAAPILTERDWLMGELE
jgi:hypothetical protein